MTSQPELRPDLFINNAKEGTPLSPIRLLKFRAGGRRAIASPGSLSRVYGGASNNVAVVYRSAEVLFYGLRDISSCAQLV
jgi:hypothetical protein